MKIPTSVLSELRSVVYRPNGMKSLRYKSNFTAFAWRYVEQLSKEDLFELCPPKELHSKGAKTGQYSSSCLNCGAKTKLISYTAGYNRYCSVKCGSLHRAHSESEEALKVRMAKMQATMVKRYGAHCSALAGLQRPRVVPEEEIVRRKQTWENIYGKPGNRTEEQQKRANDLAKRRASAFKETLRKNPKAWENSKYKRKSVTIKGRTFSVQGYEGVVMEDLVHSGRCKVDSIETSPTSISYVEHGRERIYIPDFRAKLGRRWFLIEVKSTYTAGLHKRNKTLFYNLRRKSRAAAEAGYRINTMIYEPSRDLIIEVPNIHEYSRSEVLKLFE